MFIGAINQTVRGFLGSTARALDGKKVIVGCSGNFTSEAVVSQHAKPAEIHSNDVSFYSCMLGRWLTHKPLAFEVADPEFQWLAPYLEDETKKMAAVMVLLDMLEFEKRNNPHRIRMWALYCDSFPALVNKTMGRLATADAQITITSFYEGDVLTHFERFADDPQAVFCCYAPTYAGGYERLYKRLGQIVKWTPPAYEMLDDARRDRLLDWMRARRFLWYDDRRIEGMEPVMEQRGNITKTVYLYSNVFERPALFDQIQQHQARALPDAPLAGKDIKIDLYSTVELRRIKTTDLTAYKDAFLSKAINYAEGMWAFAVLVGGVVVGFIEFKRNSIGGHSEIYMMADFCVSGTPHKRLSKLILMLVKSKDTRALLERVRQLRTTRVVTTAFTDRPVSMKYRGVFDLVKRGQTKDGQKFLNYAAEFNNLTWQETLSEWLTKHS
jgi:hypothetical protein